MEANVLDSEPTLQPLHFVVCLDLEDVVGKTTAVEVAGVDLGVEVVEPGELVSVGIQERAVGLEVNEPIGNQNLAVVVEEACAGEALVGVLHLWIGECDPYLGNFARLEKVVD